jgi:hypothetical protein
LGAVEITGVWTAISGKQKGSAGPPVENGKIQRRDAEGAEKAKRKSKSEERKAKLKGALTRKACELR